MWHLSKLAFISFEHLWSCINIIKFCISSSKGMAAIDLNAGTKLMYQRITFLDTELSKHKKCPLTNNCACWIYSQSVGGRTVEVGTCSLHVWNIPVSLITGYIWLITTAPWDGRFWVSFHLADKWCSLSSVKKEFLRKCNLGRNCKELKKLKVILWLLTALNFTKNYENVSWKIHSLPTNIPHTMSCIIILFMGAFKFQQAS